MADIMMLVDMYCWMIEMADIRMLVDNVLLDDRDG